MRTKMVKEEMEKKTGALSPKPKYERVNCYLCGSEDTKLLGTYQFKLQFTKAPVNLVQCKNCKLCFLNPRFTQDIILDYYRSDPYNHTLEDERIQFLSKNHFPHFSLNLRKIEGIKKTGRLLDVGCSYGFFLRMAREHGWETTGVELSQAHCDFARNEYNLDVFCGYVKEVKFPNNFFDVVASFQTLPYYRDPLADLIEFRRVLKEDGFVAVDFGNKIHYTKIWQIIRKLMGRDYSLQKNPFFDRDHQIFFSPKVVKKLFLKAGFKNVKLYNQKFSYRPDLGCFYQLITKILTFLFQVIWYLSAKKVYLAMSVLVTAQKNNQLHF